MNIHGIKKELLALLLELGHDSHPNEFVALLRERNGVIAELDMVPGTVTGESSASVFFDMMPLDTHSQGAPIRTRTAYSARPMLMSGSFPGPGGTT